MTLDQAIGRLETKAIRMEILAAAERGPGTAGDQMKRDAEAVRFVVAEMRRLAERQLNRDALALRLRANAALQTAVAAAMSADRPDAAKTFSDAAAVMIEAARELSDG